MKKIMIIFLMLIMMIGTVEAVSYFQYGETPIQLKRECFYEGDLCDSGYTCNVSVYDENLDIIVDDTPMNRSDSYYLHNITQLLDNGEYRTRMTCSDGTYAGSEVFYFEVTPAGEENRMNLFLILSIASLVILGLAYLIKSDEVGVLAGIVFIVTGVYSMINGIDGVYNLYSRAIAGVVIALGMLFMIASGYNLFQNNK